MNIYDMKNDLRLVVLPGRNPPLYASSIYETAYATWKSVWESAAAEVPSLPVKRDSTEFIRQDEVLALFYENQCTSMGFWTELDFRFQSSREDFYFRNWTETALNSLSSRGHRIGMYSYLTVAQGFRKTDVEGIAFKDIQIGLFVMRFLNSKMDAMTGCTRNNKSVNEVCSRGGAVFLERGIQQYGCETDLMAWYQKDLRPWAPIAELVESLWKHRVDFRRSESRDILSKEIEPRWSEISALTDKSSG